MVYWLENGTIITSIRPWPFSQGAIYKGQGMLSNMWGLDELDRDSQGFRGVNPTYLTTARSGGIFLDIARPPRLSESDGGQAFQKQP